MGSPVHETEEDIEVNIDSIRDDDDDRVVDEKRKQRSRKSRQSGSGEDANGWNGSGRKISISDRHESRKRMGGFSRDSDQDEYEIRKESRSKQVKKKQPEANTLDALSTWYQDGEVDNKHEHGGKPGNRGYNRAEESERKKSSSRHSEHETDLESLLERHSKDSSRRDNSREKRIRYAERGRNHRRRWDEADNISKTVDCGKKSDVRSGKSPDPKLDLYEREKSDPLGTELNDIKGRGLESPIDKDERQFDPKRKGQGKYEFVEDSWKRKQEKETRDGETNYENMRDWELPRHGCDRLDGRTGGRKFGNRTESVKTSSKYGISTENYDVIEIQTKPLDYARDDSGTTQISDAKQAPELESFAHPGEDRSQNTQGSAQSSDDRKDKLMDGDNQHLWRDDNDCHHEEKSRGRKGFTPSCSSAGGHPVVAR